MKRVRFVTLAAPLGLALLVGACGSDGSSSNDADGGDGTNLPDGGPRTPASCTDLAAQKPDPAPVTTHPRLLFTQADIPKLRARVVDSNPAWKDGLGDIAARARTDMDAGTIIGKDSGSAYSYSEYPIESYAELFALLSNIEPDEAARADDARRARTLLMHVIDEAAKGASADDTPFREDRFSTSNRSRWWGEGFGLTVDWIYGSLTADDKAKIRTVFLRWADENEHAEITTDNHPEPIGTRNDPKLLADQDHVYWSGNNYYTAHMRNLGFMAMAFDAADDPDGKLRDHIGSVTGAWLYVTDSLLRNELRGGLAAEGFEYGPQALGYVAQLLLAMHTAGLDSKANGDQTKLACNPFWDDTVTAFLHSVSPTGTTYDDPNYKYLGPLYSAAWYGDGDKFWAPDFIQIFGPLGVYDQLEGNADRLAKLRWIQTNVAPGGADKLTKRQSNHEFMLDPIMYFMLFDPAAETPPDPRPSIPTSYLAEGLGHMFARTDWGPDASWFAYNLGWSRLDHQHNDGNLFQLYRKGEWLTKERTGYGLQVAATDSKNGVCIENDAPDHNGEGDYENIEWKRGAQWSYSNDGPGKIVAHVMGDAYTYALGDATQLYRSTHESATDVTHASRSIIWLKPDRVVVYDRATTTKTGRFKRFFLNLPANGIVNGRSATVTTPKGQKMFLSSLLPDAATMTIAPSEALDGEPAELDPMNFRMKGRGDGKPTKRAVLARDRGGPTERATASATQLVSSKSGTPYQGALTGTILVMFPVDIGTKLDTLVYDAPAGVTAQLVTGLDPNAGYDVVTNGSTITIKPGGSTKADSGGVLLVGSL